MKKKIVYIMIGLVAATIFFASQLLVPPVVIEPQSPNGEMLSSKTDLRPVSSRVAAQVEIRTTDLETFINDEAPKSFNGKENTELAGVLTSDWISYNIHRGAVRVRNSNNGLGFSLPVHGSVSAGGKIDARFFKIPIQETVSLRGKVSGILLFGGRRRTVAPRFDSDWGFHPEVRPRLELDKAEMTIAGIGISMKGTVRKYAEPQLNAIAGQLGGLIEKTVGLKNIIQKSWIDLHLVEHISSSPELWISVRPTGVEMRPLDYTAKDRIRGVFAISFVSSLHTERPPQPAVGRLPQLVESKGISSTSQVAIPVVLPIDAINQQIKNVQFPVQIHDGLSLEIWNPSIEVRNSGQVHVKTSFRSSLGGARSGSEGTLWFQAKPLIDLSSQQIQFTELDFTVETTSELERLAVWMLEPTILKSLQDSLRFDLSGELKGAVALANQELASLELPYGVKAEIELKSAALRDLYLLAGTGQETHSIVLVLEAKGTTKGVIVDL